MKEDNIVKTNKRIAINLLIISLLSPMATPVIHAQSLTDAVNQTSQGTNPKIHKQEQQESKMYQKVPTVSSKRMKKLNINYLKKDKKPVKHNAKKHKVIRNNKKQSLSFTQRITKHLHHFVKTISSHFHHNRSHHNKVNKPRKNK